MADANNKVDLQLNIKTDYQAAGMDAATEATLKQAEAQKAAAEAAKAQAEAEKAQAQAAAAAAPELKRLAAEQKADADAAAREQAEQQAVEAAMRLATMTVKELEREMRKLNAARKAAAKAGDTEAYTKLTAQLAQTKQATEVARNAANLSTAAWAGQLQAASALGQNVSLLTDQVSNFGKNLKSGTVDVGGMTSAVLSLGAAFKAGLGPLGLAIFSIEQFYKVYKEFDKYFNGRKQTSAEMRAEAEREAKIREDARAALAAAEANDRKTAADELHKMWSDREEALEKNAEAEKQKRDAARAAEDEASRHRIALWQAEMAAASEANQKRLQQNIDEETKAAERRAAARAAEDAAAAEKYAAGLEKALSGGKYAELLKIKLPSPEELAAVKAKLDAADLELREDLEGQEQGLKQRRREIEKEMDAILAQVQKVAPAFRGSREQAVEWLAGLQETAKQQQQTVTAAKEQAAAERRAADAAKQQAANKVREVDARRVSEEEARKQAEANKDLTRAIADLLDATKTTGSYAPEEKRLKTEILAADRKLLERRRDELAALLSTTNDKDTRRSIEQQQKEVARQLQGLADAMAANTREAKGWLKEFAPPDLQARNRQAQYAVDRLNKQLAAQVKNAERAAKSGSPEAYARAKDQIARTADALKRVSGRSSEVDATLKEINDRLDGARGSAGDTQKAQGRAAKAAEKLADETEKAADKVAEQQPAESARTAEQAAADMQQQVDELKGALTAFAEQQQGLQAAVQQLATAVQNLSGHVAEALQGASKAADAAAATAKAAAAADKTLSANLNRAWGAIRDLQNGL